MNVAVLKSRPHVVTTLVVDMATNLMDILLSSSAWLAALWIFSLRVSDMTLDTLRLLFVVRGRKGIA